MPQALLSQPGGGAAAEVDGVHLMGGGVGGDLRQLAAQDGDIAVHLPLAVGQGVEVAVDALALAEGDMDIQPKGLVLFFHSGHLSPLL